MSNYERIVENYGFKFLADQRDRIVYDVEKEIVKRVATINKQLKGTCSQDVKEYQIKKTAILTMDKIFISGYRYLLIDDVHRLIENHLMLDELKNFPLLLLRQFNISYESIGSNDSLRSQVRIYYNTPFLREFVKKRKLEEDFFKKMINGLSEEEKLKVIFDEKEKVEILFQALKEEMERVKMNLYLCGIFKTLENDLLELLKGKVLEEIRTTLI